MISVVIPAFNEEKNIKVLYSRLLPVLSKIDANYEVIIVDDGSRDATENVVKELHQSDAKVKLIVFSGNFGHQVALTAGLDYARGDAVIVMDADLQHPPELLPALVAHWRNGYEIVYTVRENTLDAGAFKKLTAKFFYKFFRLASDLEISDNVADFRLFDKKVVQAFRSLRERTRFLRGLTSWMGFRTKGISYQAASRHAGQTKYNLRKMCSFAFDGIISFSAKPLQWAIYLGLIVSFLGFLFGLYAIYVRFFTTEAVSGWTSLVIVITFLGGIQIFLLGVIGVYLGKTYEETKQRPLYLISEVVGL